MEGAGTRGGILKRAGIGGNGRKQQVGNRLGDWPAGDLQQTINQFATRCIARGDPIYIRISWIADVMINVDQDFSIPDAIANLAQALKTGAIGGDNTIKLFARLRLLQTSF